MSVSDWLPIVLSLGGGALLTEGVHYYRAKRRAQKERLWWLRVYDTQEQAHTILERLGTELDAVRVVVLAAHGQGAKGPPKPDEPLLTTVVYEWPRTGEKSVIGTWHEQPAQTSYSAMLASLYQMKMVLLRTADLAVGALRDLYISSGVARSIVAEVLPEERYLYLSANLRDDVPPTAEQREAVRAAAGELRRLIGGANNR